MERRPLVAEFIVDTDYNDGYTSPEVMAEAVALMGKLNPRPLTRCRDCDRFDGLCGLCDVSGDVYVSAIPDGYCNYAERKSE